jgi:hypothetical protein
MKIRYAAMAGILAFFLIITMSGLLAGSILAQQQVTNGANDVDPMQPMLFSWSPFIDSTKYEFVLARDAAMTQIVVVADVPVPEYEYNGTLDYGTGYFWRVRALEPAPCDWSATFAFQTEAGPPSPAPSPPPPRGMSCTQASIPPPTTSSDISPLLLVGLVTGLVFVSRQRPKK